MKTIQASLLVMCFDLVGMTESRRCLVTEEIGNKQMQRFSFAHR
jgi:hypothetical protein